MSWGHAIELKQKELKNREKEELAEAKNAILQAREEAFHKAEQDLLKAENGGDDNQIATATFLLAVAHKSLIVAQLTPSLLVEQVGIDAERLI